MKKLLWILPLMLFSVFVIVGANMHPLWGDEAEAALFGRHILKYGVPKGWDGVNIMGTANGLMLNSDLVNHISPWPQFYLIAASFKIFGESDFAARLPFIVLSLMSIPLFFFLVLKLSQDKSLAFIATLMLSLSTQFILFSYQARYYPLLVFASFAFMYATISLLENKKWPNIIFYLSGVLFLYSHFLLFPLVYISLFLGTFFYFISKKTPSKQIIRFISLYLGIGSLIVLSFLPWFIKYFPIGGRLGVYQNPEDILPGFFQSTVDIVTFLNLTNVFPILILPFILIIVCIKLKRKESVALYLFLLIMVFVHYVLAISFDSFTKSDTRFVAFRYQVTLIPIFTLLLALVVNELRRIHILFSVLLLLTLVFSNIFTTYPLRSYFLEYVGEIINPPPSPNFEVVKYLSKNARTGDTAIVNLERNYDPLMFYLKDKLRFVNRIDMVNPKFFPKNRGVLPRYVYAFFDKPDWVILFSKRTDRNSFFTTEMKNVTQGLDLTRDYEEIVLPIFFSDLTRPEIFWRSFSEIEPDYDDQIFIYRKIQ